MRILHASALVPHFCRATQVCEGMQSTTGSTNQSEWGSKRTNTVGTMIYFAVCCPRMGASSLSLSFSPSSLLLSLLPLSLLSLWELSTKMVQKREGTWGVESRWEPSSLHTLRAMWHLGRSPVQYVHNVARRRANLVGEENFLAANSRVFPGLITSAVTSSTRVSQVKAAATIQLTVLY